jgi:CubicO group peptidase (beta-lactamase class C family)
VLDGGFSGAVRVDVGGETILAEARGAADRAAGVPNTLETRFAIASGTKSFTALAVVSLIVDGVLALDTRARDLLGDDLPAIDDAVTIEHLLAHRSGIGDYLDEDAMESMDDYVLSVPVHRLATAESYLQVLDGFPQVFPPGTQFAYNNGGYVVLAILAERAAGQPYADLVQTRVIEPAGMAATSFVRADERPGDVAVGYLEATGLRANVLHLPLVGVGDGGLCSTVGDIHRFWAALFDHRIVPADWVARMTTPAGETPPDQWRCGLGFWLGPSGSAVLLDGQDAGISFRSSHDPVADVTWTVMSNTTDGAWPVTTRLRELFSPQ